MKTAILLINLGTPDSPKVSDVRKYLNEFLTDKRVIDKPWLIRQILVRGVISLFRAPKSAATYKEVWTKDGSPLLLYTQKIAKALQDKYLESTNTTVFMAMRYQSPSLKNVLKQIEQERFEKVVVLPLYPQNAASSTSSTIEYVMNEMRAWEVYPEIHFINSFYNHPAYIKAWAHNTRKYLEKPYDYYVFSYHGIPQSHIVRTQCECSQNNNLQYYNSDKACNSINEKNHFCYRAQCFANTAYLVKELNLPENKVVSTFQSRLGREPWIFPYTDKVMKKLIEENKAKTFLVIPPSFIADCLETIYEIGIEYDEEVKEWGGAGTTLVESLNISDIWVESLVEMLRPYTNN